jgi:LysM repeat protein
MSRFGSDIRFDVDLTQNRNVGSWAPRAIVMHWWGDPASNPTFNGVVNWFKLRSSQVSAQYVVEAGRITQMVMEDHRAWHAGDDWANKHGIGIEVNPRLSAADYRTTAALVAEIRSRRGPLPLQPHNAYSATRCPGHMDLGLINRLAEGRAPDTVTAPASGIYIVKRGDTLGGIARRYNTSTGALQMLNGITNANRITPGQRLYVRWIVSRGQTLGGIVTAYNASRFTGRTSSTQLARINGITNPNLVRAGQAIRLP